MLEKLALAATVVGLLPYLPAAESELINEKWARSLDCREGRRWSSFRRELQYKIQSGARLATDESLVRTAQNILDAYDDPSQYNFFQEQALIWASKLEGNDLNYSADFCLPGYAAACLIRLVWWTSIYEGLTIKTHEAEAQLNEDAFFCTNIFGIDSVYDFLTATSWPIRVQDLQIHLAPIQEKRAVIPPRFAQALPPEVETYAQFLTHVEADLPDSLKLSPGSVDPQGYVQATATAAKLMSLPPTAAPRQRIVVVSVDGGHVSLWLEPAFTLRALFPEVVSMRLLSYKTFDHERVDDAIFKGEEVHVNQQYTGNPVLRSSDVIVCQWIGECAKLREEYSKPVIAYIGFLLLNDPSVGSYHKWSEPVKYFWERWQTLLDCDVHSMGRLSGRPPVDGGPACAVVFEEPQLAEAAHWQTGSRRPSVRPLSVYIGEARHDPKHHEPAVFLVNRYRLSRDTIFGKILRAAAGPGFPYRIEDQRADVKTTFAEMASYHCAVLLPWDLNLVMFHDLYAMNLPLFLPDADGLQQMSFSYFMRFIKNPAHAEQPFSERMPGAKPTEHTYSPFALAYLEPRKYWLRFTEYTRVPHVHHFAGVPDLLKQIHSLDSVTVSEGMREHNERSFNESRVFWGRALGLMSEYQRQLNTPARHVSQELVQEKHAAAQVNQAAPKLFFKMVHVPDCWFSGASAADCCDATYGPEGNVACFDDYWTYQRCCVESIEMLPLDDVKCSHTWKSTLQGVPWVQEEPSVAEPFVFLWDEKCGGTTFLTWLKHSVLALGKQETSLMYTVPGHPVVIGSQFFLKTVNPSRRSKLEVVAGQFDWRVMHEGIDCESRKKPRCLVLVRHPVDRFISYYLERSDRHFERDLGGVNRSIETWSPAAWRRYLSMVKRDRLWLDGEETGVFCNRENMQCIDLERSSKEAMPLLKRVRPKAAREKFYFRFLGGPQDRLAWMLDPDNGDPRVATWRLSRCIVGLQTEDFDGYREVLGWHFPWIHEVKPPASESSQKAFGRVNSRARRIRRLLPMFARNLIAEFNARDMFIYRAAKRQFRKQLERIRFARGGAAARWPPVAWTTAAEVEEAISQSLSHTATHRTHGRLNRYMLGLPAEPG
eukprot:TRINITY_DN58024_c0_g1_i1.p1 TRINITY_DN58024_c0_g1~~TRINITY_DN58024_c0_g1_i1.p1  ORF type:complete len:1106 (-),score=184.54 TRINITY_DN58024_c0_g1_i1:87-3404(-)